MYIQKDRKALVICFALASVLVYFNAFNLGMLMLWIFSFALFSLFSFAIYAKHMATQLPLIKNFITKAVENGLTEAEAVTRGIYVSGTLLVVIPLLWKWAHYQ